MYLLHGTSRSVRMQCWHRLSRTTMGAPRMVAPATAASETSTAVKVASFLAEDQIHEDRWSLTNQARQHRFVLPIVESFVTGSIVFRVRRAHLQTSSHLLQSEPPLLPILLLRLPPLTMVMAFLHFLQILARQHPRARSAFHQPPLSSVMADRVGESV
jgi:hypothetical protein